MAILQFRDLLCWNSSSQARAVWKPSPHDQTWRPNTEYYPDTLRLLPGDILLFQPVKPTLAQKISQSYQQSGFTHAAIYVGFDHEICEATPSGGVAISSLEDSIRDNCLLARRVPHLTPEDRNRIALEAGQLRGTPYAFNRYLALNPKTNDNPRHGIICSTLCEHALLVATKGDLACGTASATSSRGPAWPKPPNSPTSR